MNKASPLIAIVDDEESVRKAVGRLFRSAGMNVETFVSGTEFLNTMAKHSFDCLVLNQHMPGVSGLEVQAPVGATVGRPFGYSSSAMLY